MLPVIGILFCGFDKNRQFVTHSYVEAISESGGIPLVIPYSSRTQKENTLSASELFQKYFEICDGFLFCGGHDVSPLLFGEELLTSHGHTDWKSDSFHILFMKKLLSLNIPLLSICRGMQIMNVALGGTIYQDISLRPKPSLNHMQSSMDRSDICHKISVQKSSMLYNFCGDLTHVNSFHHQCIKDPGTGISEAAVASDGIIEAIELSSHPFALGVQWHPECMFQTNTSMQKLFSAFINAAKKSKDLFFI